MHALCVLIHTFNFFFRAIPIYGVLPYTIILATADCLLKVVAVSMNDFKKHIWHPL